MTPFCQTSNRSRRANSNVMMVEKNAAIMTIAAYTFPYSAHPCAQLTYHPNPDFTPTVSATTRVRNDVPNPINSPMKMLGIAAGIATRKIRYNRPAPIVRATSRYDAFVFEIPEAVSMVTGNQTASAISETAERSAEGKMTIASGIHAVAGIGPTIFKIGIPQYRALDDQPMMMPLISPEREPARYPPIRRISECQVL